MLAQTFLPTFKLSESLVDITVCRHKCLDKDQYPNSKSSYKALWISFVNTSSYLCRLSYRQSLLLNKARETFVFASLPLCIDQKCDFIYMLDFVDA